MSSSASGNGIERVFEDLIKFTTNHIIKNSTFNCRLAHRNRLNIFDIIKSVSSVKMSLSELKLYILWMNSNTDASKKLRKLLKMSKTYNQPVCKNDLKFFIEISDTKKPGFEYFPPTPPSFTYKFTPIFGKREDEAVNIMKKKTDEKLKIEDNLYKSIVSKGELMYINYDSI